MKTIVNLGRTACIIIALTLLPPLGALAAEGQESPGAQAMRDISWSWTGGPEGAWVKCLTTTPGGALLAGTENGGIFRSSDGGATWATSDSGIEWPCCNYQIASFAVSGPNIYAGSWGGGAFRSVDDGETWSATGVVPGDPYPIVTALAACMHGDRVYAGGNFGAVISNDGGASWTQVSDGLSGGWVRDLTLRGTTPYAMLDDGVYRLTPGSTAWVAWNDGLPAVNGMQSFRPTADALYLATHEGGVFHLDCGDSSWVFLNDGLWDDNVDAIVEIDRSLYAGTMGNGLFRYDSQFATWTAVPEGLWNRDIRSLTHRGIHLFAGTFGGGVFAFDTVSDTWTTECPGMISPMITSLAYDGTAVYAGLEGGGVFRSEDHGDTWTRSLTGVVEISAFDLWADATAVYASTWNGVMKSTDQGQSWTPAGLQGNGIFSLDFWSLTLYAGSFDGRVWASTDGGDSWSSVGTGLPNGILRGVVRMGTALHAAVNGHGVYALPDGQTAWTAINAGLPDLSPGCLTLGGGTLCIGTETDGVWRWNAGTESWDSTGLTDRTVFCITDVGTQLLAGTWGELYTSGDGGQTWTLETSGLKPWLAVRAIGSGGGYLYAGLGGGGVWRAANPVGIPANPIDGATGTMLSVRPNPAGSSNRIVFRLTHPGRVDLGVFDSSGRKIAAIESGDLAAGAHEAVWDGRMSNGSTTPSGAYTIRLEADGLELTRKVIRIE